MSLRILILTFLLGLCVLFSEKAHAQVPLATEQVDQEKAQAEQARAHFTRGNELYAAGDVLGTLVEFERAYALRPSPLLSFHIGSVALELRRHARSYRAFSEFLTTSPRHSSDSSLTQRRAEAEQRLVELEPHVAHLEIGVNVEGAQLYINDQSVGVSPVADDFVLDPGSVDVRGFKVGYEPVSRQLTLAAGDRMKIAFELTDTQLDRPALPLVARASGARTPLGGSASPKRPLMTRGLWLGFGAAGALGVAGCVTGIMAWRLSSDLEGTRFTGSSARRDFRDESDRARALAISTDVLLGAALVTAQASLFVILWRRHERHAPDAQMQSVRASLFPSGITLDTRF